MSNPKTCGDCRYYRPYRDIATNRILPSRGGDCGWRPEDKWPMAFLHHGLAPMVLPQSAVWKTMDADECERFQGKGKS